MSQRSDEEEEDDNVTFNSEYTVLSPGSNFDIKFDRNLNDFRNRIPPSLSFAQQKDVCMYMYTTNPFVR